MNEIIDPFKESLFNDKFKGILGDTIEIGIDSILTDDSLREIPIVNTIIGTFKFGQNIHDRNLLKQTMIFIQEFNNNSNNEKVQKYISKYKKNITNNPKKAEIELGRVMIILNRNIDDIKSSILAKLYLSYIENKIDWSKFCDLSEVNERLSKVIIEEQSEAYILDKATSLDMDVTAEVEARRGDGELWYPYEATLSGEYTDAQKNELSELIEAELAIPAQRQNWLR